MSAAVEVNSSGNSAVEKKDKDKNYSGIPDAPFIEDVDAYMAKGDHGKEAEQVLAYLDDLHRKYKFMDFNLTSKKRRLINQIPEIEKSLELLARLEHKRAKEENLDTLFLLSDHLHLKARVPPTENVGLWLGANVMLEYSIADAKALLEKNLQNARNNLSMIEHDLKFLRDQCTTTEVTMARVYNWDVKRRQKEGSAGGPSGKGKNSS
ncbi:unnamed protein product [Cyprideis torosa]|uniref:Prefoldin subunit 3 n=1 Tax=Cyprideis torosa TaxID=163714 RepID=A0A7R8ZNZ7_9CRUS|nr:unnamed protein product [Cyprideis torosa]CAG0888744.1 unnamed protein product [Cyprideis torosa]